MILSDRERQAPTDISSTEPSHLARYEFAANFLNPDFVVLDIPCGTGYGSSLLSRSSKSVLGLDICAPAIEHAREFFHNKNVTFVTGDMDALEEATILHNKKFDMIVSFEGIEHINRQEKFLQHIKNNLAKDGTFIVSTPRKPHGNPFHTIEFSQEEFTFILSKYFRIENLYGQIYTDIFTLKSRNIDPKDYERFNFIAICKGM